ncbi:hypothetical protein GOBAR_AA19036 [Gossypium barbadense]|uniref:DUF676 domain-containing protein n=1 Tax=Gossypium barbadense TaxID=3634 RepID=A0A2P5XE72_GOSBA|nr:hypothetical protein GOBAR_AA19036 [Gossypium barbadense]
MSTTTQGGFAASGRIGNGKNEPDHLLVLVHGILASPSDWTYAEAELKRQLGRNFLIYASSCNSHTKTFAGVDGAGKRLAEEVLQVVKKRESLKRISFLAHSLGGLFARYAVAALYSECDSSGTQSNNVTDSSDGNLQTSTPSTQGMIAGLEPVSFITLATPHLGVRGRKQVCSRWCWLSSFIMFWSQTVATLCQRTVKLVVVRLVSHPAQRDYSLQDYLFLRLRVSSCNSHTKTFAGVDGAGKRLAEELPFLLGLPILEKLAPPIAPLVVGRTGKQLFLTDGKPSRPPLLLRMASDCEGGKFLSALGAFRNRTVYANVSYDHMVGWRTSSIRREKELVKPPSQSLDGYKHVVDVEYCPPVSSDGPHFPLEAAKAKAAAKNAPNIKNTVEYHELMEEEMIQGLQKLGWKKVDVSFHSSLWPFFAHNNIHVKNEWFHNAGAGVIAHVADTLKQQESSSSFISSSL